VLRKVDSADAGGVEHIKQHVTIGYTILADLKPIRNLLPGVLYITSAWNGKGYPMVWPAKPSAAGAHPRRRRRYDAMSTSRPYREALAVPVEVEDRLIKGAGSQRDAK